MRFPYMKVLVWVLTFVGYSYSGYGSSVLSSLRDAVLSAEIIFGDVFKNLITVSKKFKTVHEIFDSAVEENCVYKCPGDVRPLKNKLHTPSSDGCGSMGMKIDSEYLPAPEMAKCCDSHDICYDTCNSDKELCDLDFKRCLYKYCDTFDKEGPTGDVFMKGCKAAAKVLFTGTMTLGCKSYQDSQQRACFCPSTGNPNQSKASGNPNQSKNAQNQPKNGKEREKYSGKKQKDKKGYGWKTNDEI